VFLLKYALVTKDAAPTDTLLPVYSFCVTFNNDAGIHKILRFNCSKM